MPVPTTLDVTDPRQWGYHARLGNTLLRLATTPDRQFIVRRSVAQTPSVNTAANPEDFTDTFGRSYSQVDFSGGDGLRYAHRRSNPDNSNTRFFDSYGVQVDELGRVSLLNDTESIVSTQYLLLDGTGDYASVPDGDALDVVGDLDITVDVALNDYTPAATLSVLDNFDANKGYFLFVNTAGTLSLGWGTGSGLVIRTSTVATGLTDLTRHTLRATLDVDNGAAGHDVTFYVDGVQLGAVVTTAGVTSIAASTVALFIGANSTGGGNAVAGKFYSATVKNGIGGTSVLDVDFTDALSFTPGATTGTADTGQTVTLVGDAAITNSTLTTPARAAYNGTDLFWTADSPDLTKASNLTAATPTLTTEVTGAINDLLDVAALGGVLYVAEGTEIRTDQGTGTWANWSALNATRLWSVKNRIIASDGASLYEDPDGAGPFTSLVDLQGSSTWRDVADAGEFVIAAADDGYVYSFAFNGTALSLAAQSTFEQETPCAVAALHGVVAVLTHQEEDDATYVKRLWVGSIGDGGALVGMQVVREWFGLSTPQTPCVLVAPERDGIYTAVIEDGESALWRYDIEDAATVRDLIHTHTEATTTILKVEGRFWTWGADGSVTREQNALRATGYVVGPLVDFFTSDNKVWDSVKVDGEFSGGTLSVAVSTSPLALDNGGTDVYWTAVKTITNNDDTYTPLSLDPSRYLATRVTLSGSVSLVAYTLRAMPPISDEELTFFINVSDLITRTGRTPTDIKGYGDSVWNAVRDLQGQSLELEVYPLGITWRGALTDVQTPVPSLLERGAVTRTMQVNFRGREVQEITTTSGTFGTFGWGGAQFGKAPA